MTPRPVDVASVQAELRSLDELGSALRLVGEVDGARLGQDVLLRLAVERALTQAVDLIVAVCSHVSPPRRRRFRRRTAMPSALPPSTA